jgi:hypothetical protein
MFEAIDRLIERMDQDTVTGYLLVRSNDGASRPVYGVAARYLSAAAVPFHEAKEGDLVKVGDTYRWFGQTKGDRIALRLKN